jgi:hypothetical protein
MEAKEMTADEVVYWEKLNSEATAQQQKKILDVAKKGTALFSWAQDPEVLAEALADQQEQKYGAQLKAHDRHGGRAGGVFYSL